MGRSHDPARQLATSHDRQRAILMTASGQLHGRHWAVFRGRRHTWLLEMSAAAAPLALWDPAGHLRGGAGQSSGHSQCAAA
ncbi:MAG TPA: hypothetical protein VE197_14095, partial [Mycobacterium sp.]|nr:hypothetical protein [Mycobacterium sp.]